MAQQEAVSKSEQGLAVGALADRHRAERADLSGVRRGRGPGRGAGRAGRGSAEDAEVASRAGPGWSHGAQGCLPRATDVKPSQAPAPGSALFGPDVVKGGEARRLIKPTGENNARRNLCCFAGEKSEHRLRYLLG